VILFGIFYGIVFAAFQQNDSRISSLTIVNSKATFFKYGKKQEIYSNHFKDSSVRFRL